MAVVREDVVRLSFDINGKAELDKSRDALDELKQIAGSGVGSDAFDEMIKESKKAAKGVEEVADAAKGIKPDGIDDTVKGLKDTDKKGESAFKQLKKIAQMKFNKTVSGLSNIGTQLKKVGIQAGKLLAKGIAVGVAGVGALVAKSVMNYADYQQLVGGVDTLFKDSSGTVQKYADNAWKTAGLSANDYMSTVTSFSASLIQSLGGNTGAAAEYANMAITDMSDNANKMGTDMSSIQDAYQGFAKQNYTMLDNLKLGYGGTQEEMKRLLKDAEKLTGKAFKISSYSDVVEAIHAIQENMGITGTTAKEASETITGSASAMKSAWGNTLTSLILGGDDLDRNIANLVESVKTFAKNLMPALVAGLGGVGSLIEQLCPLIEENIPVIVSTLLPPLIKAATSLVAGLIVALPDIVGSLIGQLPAVLNQLWESVTTAFGEIPGLQKAKDFLDGLVKLITDNVEKIKKLIPAALGLVIAFKLFNKIKGIAGLFGGKGGSGGSGGGFFASLANMKTATVLKGIGNLAIIIGGLALLATVLMWAAPYMAQLSDLKSIGEVLLVMGLVGLLGAAMTKLAAYVGNIPVATVAKGLANIAIVMLGFGALAAVLMWLAPYMASMSDMKSVGEVLLVIGVVGLLGAALSKLAASVGNIPVTTVLKGVANIAIVMLGFGALAAILMLVSPYMAKMSDVESITKVLIVIGVVGLIGSGLAALAGLVGNIPVGTVLNGVANIAIALVGFGALAAVLMWLAPYMAQLSDLGTTMKILLVIGVTGLVGSALAGLAGIVGAIPIVAILSGLANIALALGGFALIAAAFGALQKVDGFTELMKSGGKVLADICGIIGNMAGSLIGGLGEGISDSLPAIGENLSKFATSASTAFTTFGSINSSGLGDFASALGKLMGVLVGDAVLSFFTGGNDYATFGTKLSDFATNAKTFFSTVKSIPDESFGKMTSLFNALAGVNSLPKDGGVTGWFEGEIDFSKFATGMKELGSNEVIAALEKIQKIPAAGFTALTSLFNALAGISSLPKDGGVVGWFEGEVAFDKIAGGLVSLGSATTIAALTAISKVPAAAFTSLTTLFNALAGISALPKDGGVRGWFEGEVSFDKIASGLISLASDGFITAIGKIQGIPAAGFTAITNLFNALAGIKGLPDSGGVFQWFTGDATTTLTTVAAALPGIATNVATFFTNLGGITDFTVIGDLFDEFNDIEIDSDALDKGFLGLGQTKMAELGTALSSFATNAASFFTAIKNVNGENVDKFFDGLKSADKLPEALTTLDGTVGTSLSNLVTTANTKLTELKSKFSDNLGAIIALMNAAATAMYSSGVAIMAGVNNGMESMRWRLVATAASIAAAIQAAFDVELDINSPSRKTFKSGVFVGEGYDLGMQSMIPRLKATAAAMGNAAIPYNSHYSPDSASTVTNNTSSETMTIAPAFNLTISGTQDDRSTARKVKQWVNEAMNEFFESLDRKIPEPREA